MIVGDPTIGVGLIVVLYFWTAISCFISCFITTRALDAEYAGGSRELLTWRCLSALFLGLGVYKQLDHSMEIGEAFRAFAYSESWYDQRRFVQRAFIVLVAITCVVAGHFILRWSRTTPAPTRLALSGATIMLGFVLIRAASLHNIDLFLRDETILGLRWDWILETGAICVVLLASLWRQLGIADSKPALSGTGRPPLGGPR
jgi:hypothetical protein